MQGDRRPGDYPTEWIVGETLGSNDVARVFNVSPTTIIRWAKEGRIGFFRTPNGIRVFPECEVRRVMRAEPPPEFVMKNAERDRVEYRKKWEDGWHNNGVKHPFMRNAEAKATENAEGDE